MKILELKLLPQKKNDKIFRIERKLEEKISI